MKKILLFFVPLSMFLNNCITCSALSDESKNLLNKIKFRMKNIKKKIEKERKASKVYRQTKKEKTLTKPSLLTRVKSVPLQREPRPVLLQKKPAQTSDETDDKTRVESTNNWKMFLEDEINYLSQKYKNGQFFRAKKALENKNYSKARDEFYKAKKMIKSGAILVDPAKGIWSAADDLEVGNFW
ncbi:hypothetical protein ACFL35_14700 [Candidatus Riflebacteria bacterium]